MQPRSPAMTVRQLPNREKSPPTADPAAATVAASTAAAAATDPAAGRKKRKKRAEEDASAATTRRRVRPRAEPDTAVGTPTVGEPATPGRAYRGKCLYQSRKCENERALKRNGQPHNLCEEHRSKQNQHQRKFDAKKFSRRRRSDGEAEDNNEDDGVHAGSGSSPTNAPTPKTEPVEDQNQPPHQQQSVRLHPHAGIPPLPSLAPPAVTLPPRTMPQEYAGLVLAPPPPSANYRLTPPSSQPLLQHQFTLPHQQPSPMHQQSAFDGRPSMPRYSLSELEAARVLVPTTSAPPPSTTPSAFVDVRHEMQSNMQFSYQQQMPSTYRRQMSAPAPAPLRRLEDMRGTSPKPMLPSLLRPPPHSFPPSPHNSTFGMSALRSPLMSSSASPLSSVPRLSSLPASVAPPAPTIERLPPLHARRPPLGPATSQ